MSDFENIVFPHIMYMPGPEAQKAKIGLFYMGGESKETPKLIVGKDMIYQIIGTHQIEKLRENMSGV